MPISSATRTSEFAPAARARLAALKEAEAAAAAWEALKDSKSAADFAAYVERYPNAEFAPAARARLAALQEAQTAVKNVPALEVLDADMIAGHTAPLREAPDIRAKQVGRLKEGETVHVAGKLKSGGWYGVQLKGGTLAYVASIALEEPAAFQARKEKEQREREAEKQRESSQAPEKVASAPSAAAAPAAGPGKSGPNDGRYVGRITCEQIPNSTMGPVSVEAVVVVSGARADFSRSVLTLDGSSIRGKETASGSLAADGTMSLTGGAQGPDWHFDSAYQGKLRDGRIELSGTESIPRPGRSPYARNCKVSVARQ